MASDEPPGADGIHIATKLNLQCSNDRTFLYDNNVITEKELDDWKEEVKHLIEWHRST